MVASRALSRPLQDVIHRCVADDESLLPGLVSSEGKKLLDCQRRRPYDLL